MLKIVFNDSERVTGGKLVGFSFKVAEVGLFFQLKSILSSCKHFLESESF